MTQKYDGELTNNLSVAIRSVADELSALQSDVTGDRCQLSLAELLKHIALMRNAVENCRRLIDNKGGGWDKIRTYARGVSFYINAKNISPLDDCNTVLGKNGCELLENNSDPIQYDLNHPVRIDGIKFANHLEGLEEWMDSTSSLNERYREEWLQCQFPVQLEEVMGMARAILFPLKLVERFPSYSAGQIYKRSASLRLLSLSLKLTDQSTLDGHLKTRSSIYRSIYNHKLLRKRVLRRRL